MDPYNSYDSSELARTRGDAVAPPIGKRRDKRDVDARMGHLAKAFTALHLAFATYGAAKGDLYIPLRNGGFHLSGISALIMWMAYVALFAAAWWPRRKTLTGSWTIPALLAAWLLLAVVAVTTADTLSPAAPRALTPAEAQVQDAIQQADRAAQQADAALREAERIERESRR